MLKKDITFIYMDSAEKSIYMPIAEEAQKRGYSVKFTTNKFEKCNIGFYCQHINFPQFSKFSVIMLHDIIQQFGNWPDIWIREPWNKYNIGIVPSYQWEKNWKTASKSYYTRAKQGVYRIGWPKADVVANLDREAYKKEFCEKYGLDYTKRTILYAPSWEAFNKQDDFVRAMQLLDVNILIKQYNATPDNFPEVYREITKMRRLHENLQHVTIMDPKSSIFDAIMAADVLVSDESSTMAEATMLGIPAVSVSDWLIPDVIPYRYPECNYDFAIMTQKANLKECIEKIICHYSDYEKNAKMYRDKTFCNIGKTSCMIMDIIDDCVNGNMIRYTSIQPLNKKRLPLKQYLKHKYIIINREIRYNYCVRNRIVSAVWGVITDIKRKLIKKHVV